MLPWSRSSTSTPPIPSSTSSIITDSNQPTFLANHHRTSTSSINKSIGTNKSNSKGKFTAESKGVITDEEDWSDGSDDENKRNKLAVLTLNQRIPTSVSSGSISKSASNLVMDSSSSSSNNGVGTNNENNSSSSNLKTTINTSTSSNNLSSSTSPTSPITPTSSSSWSFNPFSLISPKSPSTPTPPPTTTNSNSTITTTSNEINSTTSHSNSKGKQVAIESEDTEEEEVAPIIERRGSHYRADQLREAIKPNVEDLVKGESTSLSSCLSSSY